MVRAKGRLRHHFWGDYHATIVLAFNDAASARDASVTLGDQWKPAKSTDAALVWHGTGEDFERVKEQLQSFAFAPVACGRKGCSSQCSDATIDSVNHSIDLGPEFIVEVPSVPAEQLVAPWA
jgi:hypothetical protein